MFTTYISQSSQSLIYPYKQWDVDSLVTCRRGVAEPWGGPDRRELLGELVRHAEPPSRRAMGKWDILASKDVAGSLLEILGDS